MSDHYQVELTQQPIELYKLLKIANLVSGGGEAKVVISEGYVLLNNNVETQKRKKIYHGDMIEFNGDIIELICHSAPLEISRKPKKSSEAKAKNKTNNQKGKTKRQDKNKKAAPDKQKPETGKRRSINF